jgi:hypothetical protein
MGSRQTLTGEMERFRPRAQRLAVVCLLGLPLAILWISAARQLIWHVHTRRDAPLPAIVLITAAMFWVIAASFRSLSRKITAFSYDGSTLRFRTGDQSEVRARPIDELSQLNPWYGRGRGPGQMSGYRLMFCDRQELLLELRVSSSQSLAERLQADRWPEHQATL